MKTGFRGTFVISWSQTEVDGLEASPVQSLSVGAAWSWRGDVVRVDGPSEVLRLERADGDRINRKRAARMVRRLVGAAIRADGQMVAGLICQKNAHRQRLEREGATTMVKPGARGMCLGHGRKYRSC